MEKQSQLVSTRKSLHKVLLAAMHKLCDDIWQSLPEVIFTKSANTDSDIARADYLEYIPHVRSNRSQIKTAIAEGVQAAFDADNTRKADSASSSMLQILAEDEEIETSILVTSLVTRLQLDHTTVLEAIKRSITSRMPGSANPVDPHRMISVFVRAIGQEPPRLQAVIVEELSRVAPKVFAQLLSKVTAVLQIEGSGSRRNTATVEPHGSRRGGRGSDESPTIPEVAVQQLVQLQQLVPSPPVSDNPLHWSNWVHSRHEQLANVTRNLSPAGQQAFEVAAQVINSVLTDSDLSVPARLLIARLQVPVIKLAIVDPGFLENDQHPARLFMNLLAGCGVGWDDDLERTATDRLYKNCENVVNWLVETFTTDIDVFITAAEKLRAILALAKKRQQLIDQRLVEATTGNEKLTVAKEHIDGIIKRVTKNIDLSADLKAFVDHTLHRALVFVYVRHGAVSQEWEQAAGTLNKLVHLEASTTIAPVEADALLESLRYWCKFAGLQDLDVQQQLNNTRTYFENRCKHQKKGIGYELQEVPVENPIELEGVPQVEPFRAAEEFIDYLDVGDLVTLTTNQQATEAVLTKINADKFTFACKNEKVEIQLTRAEIVKMFRLNRIYYTDANLTISSRLDQLIGHLIQP